MKPGIEHPDKWPHGRACVIALALLLASAGAAPAEELKIGGTGSALGSMQLLANAFAAGNPDIRITTIPSLGSGGSIKALAAGAIGLAVTSRPLTASERKLDAVEIEYARTPFVIAISTRSRVSAITSAQLADIYAGRMLAWADGIPVRVVLRPAGDADTELLKNISPDVRRTLAAAEARPGVQFAVTDQDAASDLERIPGAVGPSSLALIVSEKRALRALDLDGREPTPTNAASGAYPHYKRLFLVTGARRSAGVERFVAFVQSPTGRQILAANGQWIP